MAEPARLTVADAAIGGFGANRFWVGGNPLELPPRNQSATAIVTNTSNNPDPLGLSTLLGPVDEIVMGERLIGRLEVLAGAKTLAVTTTVGARDHGVTADGFLTVESTNATHPARFESGDEQASGLFVATGPDTATLVTVSDDGVLTLTRLSLADGVSNALMFVDGLEADEGGAGRRSTVVAPLAAADLTVATDAATGDCIIGKVGQGTLNISNGGLVRCRQIAV